MEDKYRRTGRSTRCIDHSVQIFFNKKAVIFPLRTLSTQDLRRLSHRFGKEYDNLMVYDPSTVDVEIGKVQRHLISSFQKRLDFEHGPGIFKKEDEGIVVIFSLNISNSQ